MYYHITDAYLEDKILREGIKGNPVVYLTTQREAALCIRECQLRLGERFGPSVIFGVHFTGDCWIDPNAHQDHQQPVAFMVYADIPPNDLYVTYA